MHTYGAEVHETGKSDDPGVFGVDDIATIELEENGPALDTRMIERSTKQRTDQKTIG